MEPTVKLLQNLGTLKFRLKVKERQEKVKFLASSGAKTEPQNRKALTTNFCAKTSTKQAKLCWKMETLATNVQTAPSRIPAQSSARSVQAASTAKMVLALIARLERTEVHLTMIKAVNNVQKAHGPFQALTVLPHVLSVKEARFYLATAHVAINALLDHSGMAFANNVMMERHQMEPRSAHNALPPTQ